MRWFWRGQKEVVQETTGGLEEAKQAAQKSQRDVSRVDKLIKEVRPVMGELHRRREVNGFTTIFEQALRGEGGKT